MRKLLLLVTAGLLALASPAQAQKSKSDITTEINSFFADNTSGQITPAKLRTVTTDIVNSYVDWLTCAGTGGLVYWSAGTPTCLDAGTAGYVLQTNGPAAPPSWLSLNVLVTLNAGNSILITGTNPYTIALSSTPNLGTPSAVTLTNGTGLPISGISGLGAGVGTWLGTPSSANLAAALTDETGSGASVFRVAPDLSNPIISGTTPSTTGALGFSTGFLNWYDGSAIRTSVAADTTQTLTNKTLNCANNTCTVRIGSDVSGLGTNVASALGTATGSAGGFPRIIATGTIALGTSAISASTCAAAVTSSATGTATTDIIDVGFNGDPTATTGYTAGAMLSIIPYPTSNTVNVKVCNNTGASITPGAVTLNWRVLR